MLAKPPLLTWWKSNSASLHQTQSGSIRRANLRYPNADLRSLDLVEERGLDRSMLAGLGTCSFIDRQQNVVFQGFTGSGKSYLGCALVSRVNDSFAVDFAD
jgi:DNA replication protein DnaC